MSVTSLYAQPVQRKNIVLGEARGRQSLPALDFRNQSTGKSTSGGGCPSP